MTTDIYASVDVGRINIKAAQLGATGCLSASAGEGTGGQATRGTHQALLRQRREELRG
jgi:hypothetical protein